MKGKKKNPQAHLFFSMSYKGFIFISVFISDLLYLLHLLWIVIIILLLLFSHKKEM